MPPVEEQELDQKALYWEKTGVNAEGQIVVGSTPTELDVRWDDNFQVNLDPKKSTISYDAEVVLLQDVVIGSLMWSGSLEDLLIANSGSTGPPTSLLFQVVKFDKTPDLKGREMRRVAKLMRFNDTLPTS